MRAPPRSMPAFGGIGVERSYHVKATFGEAPVIAERVAQVARPDKRDVVLLVEPELAVDLLAEEAGVIADAPCPVGPEIGQVFSDLCSVDARTDREFLRRHGRMPCLVRFCQRAEVQRETLHSRFGEQSSHRHEDNRTPRQVVARTGIQERPPM